MRNEVARLPNQDDYLCYSDVTNTTSEYDSSDDDSNDDFDIPDPIIGRVEKQQYGGFENQR